VVNVAVRPTFEQALKLIKESGSVISGLQQWNTVSTLCVRACSLCSGNHEQKKQHAGESSFHIPHTLHLSFRLFRLIFMTFSQILGSLPALPENRRL
jgi:hypothetical protein